MERKTITIAVSPSVWKKLNAMKKPGESFDDVLERILRGENNGK